MRTAALALVLGACFSPTPPEGAPCNGTLSCPSPLFCNASGFCVRSDLPEVDAPVDSDPPVEVFIPPDADLSCRCEANVLTCSGVVQDCAFGCTLDTVDRCRRVRPSNEVDATLVGTVNGALAITGDAMFDTSTGAITGAITRDPGQGVIAGIGFAVHVYQSVEIGTWYFDEVSVASDATLRVVGVRSAVLLADTIVLDGFVDASAPGGADPIIPGPGGKSGAVTVVGAPATCSARSGITDAATVGDSGGGGGGGGNSGADGGAAGALAGGAGGTSCGNPSVIPLIGGGGGAGGGRGGGAADATSRGGGGGGALQLTALTSIRIAGGVFAHGAGGGGGPGMTGDSTGGAGGGGGGGILVEAPTITITGAALAANGGGGGAGAMGMTAGMRGQDGRDDAIPAAGGPMNGTVGFPGGAGGAGAIAPAAGGAAGAAQNGGGGGGAAGRIFFRGDVMGTPAVASPDPNSGMLQTE